MTPGDAFVAWVESQAGLEAARNARSLWPLLAAWISGGNGATAATAPSLHDPRGVARRSWRWIDRGLAANLARLSDLTRATPGQIAAARCGDIAEGADGVLRWSIRRVGARRPQQIALPEAAASALAGVVACGRGNGTGPGAEEPLVAGGWSARRVRYAIRVGMGGRGARESEPPEPEAAAG